MTDHTPAPLPVGAHDPEVLAEKPIDPPGLPKPPDDIDRELATFVQAMHDEPWQPRMDLRLDTATVPDVLARRVNADLPAFTTREALLAHIAELWKRERDAAREWGEVVRRREEARVVFEKMRAERLTATEHLFVLGLDVEGDHEVVEPTPEAPPIADDQIV